MTYRPPKKLRSLFAALVAIALVAASCGGGSADNAEASAPALAPAGRAGQADQSVQSVQSEEVTAEGSFVVATVGGGQIDFGSLEGQDIVLWFWAPW